MKKLILGVAAAATLLTGCASEEPTVKKNTAEAEKKKAEEKKAYVGDTVTFKDVSVTFSKMEKKSQLGDPEFPTKAKGEYILFNITMNNKSDETITTSTDEFALYVNKAKHDSSMDVCDLGDAAFIGGDISPDTKIANKVIGFDVKKGANLKGTYIEWKPYIDGEEKIIKIYLK